MATYWFVLIYVMLYNLCDSSHIHYKENQQARSQIINCTGNDICNIHVTGKKALHKSTINCEFQSIMTKIFDKLVAAKGKPEALQIPDLINHTNKSLMLLGDANFNINMFRRNLMKPELKDQYKKLCAENIPFTAELFGEDLPKLAKDIGETAKISNQLKAPNKFQAAGRGRGQDQRKNYRYEPYNYSRFQSRRGGNQSSYSSHSNNRNPPKRNFHPRQNDKSKP